MKRIIIVVDGGRVAHVSAEEPVEVLVVQWSSESGPDTLNLPLALDRETGTVIDQSPAYVNVPDDIESDPAWIAEVWRHQRIWPQPLVETDQFFG